MDSEITIPQEIKEVQISPATSISNRDTPSVGQDDYSISDFNILFHISDIDTRLEKPSKFKLKMRKLFGMNYTMDFSEFDMTAREINNCCLKHIKDLHELHLRRLQALELLNDLVERADVAYIDTTYVVHLIWSIMSCMHHFQLRFRSGTNAIVTFTRRQKAQECISTYDRLINVLPSGMHRVILNSLIIFYKEGKLWTIEFALTDLICHLLYLYDDIEQAMEDILTTAETASLYSDLEARMLIKVLYEILGKIKWSHMSEEMLRRFLVMLRKSVLPKPEYVYNYAPMRRGLNICLRNITRNLKNTDLLTLLVIIIGKITLREMEDDTLLEFGNIAEFAALRYRTEKYQASLPDDLIANLCTMISSEMEMHNLFGFRVFNNLLDRHNNRIEFENPKIYFKGVRYHIRIAKYSVHDKSYFKKYRNTFHEMCLSALKKHYQIRVNLENLYASLAILCVEIPCAYTASSIVCLAMAMQEYILKEQEESNMIGSHHVHALVISLMSLVCYVHRAETFYNYITMITERRAELAPHLNPPLKASYKYAQHHILWNKPDLFFEDWEARYGLWKCFRAYKKNKEREDQQDESTIEES